MIQRLISGLVSNEVADIRRRLTGLGLIIAAFFFMLLAAGFAFVALYHRLTIAMPAWQAAAWVAASIGVAAIVLLMIGRSTLRRRSRYHQEIRKEIHALMGHVPGSGAAGEQNRSATAGLVATAMIAGFVIGKRLVK